MNFVSRALGLVTRVKELGVKESALRYYRSGDVHQLYGKEVGKDTFGNIYYEALPGTARMGRERWVWYPNKGMDTSTIPPEWHQWLHHVVDEIPSQTDLSAFKPHYLRNRIRNYTGTKNAYSSPHYLGHKEWTGFKQAYEDWTPEPKDSSGNPSL